MTPNPINSRLDAGLHKLFKDEALKRKTSMLELQKRLLKNIPVTPLDLFAQNEEFFKKRK